MKKKKREKETNVETRKSVPKVDIVMRFGYELEMR